MTIDLSSLPAELREEMDRLRTVNISSGAYIRLLEGALRAAWTAGEPQRRELLTRPEQELDEAERRLRAAWEVVGEVVLRLAPDA